MLQVLEAYDSVILYTTLEVQDSSGSTGNPVMVNGARDLNNTTINQLQVLQCSKSVVAQSAFVDTETTRVNGSSIYPDIYKTVSTWESFMNLNLTTDNSTLLGSSVWAEIFDTSYDMTYDDISDSFTNVEGYLMGYLGLDPLNSTVNSLQLHDIENALSTLVATFFWTAGHIPTDAITLQSFTPDSSINRPDAIVVQPVVTITASLSGATTTVPVPPVLAAGTTTAQQVRTLVRLNISQLAVWCGFGTSIILLILSASSIASYRGPDDFFPGPGVLQAIWWSQKNPEHIDFLRDVRQPTELRLRTAGIGDIPKKSSSKIKPEHFKRLKPESGSSAHTIPMFNWSKIICIILHILLVLVHVMALWVRVTNRDHQIVFQLGLQGVISLWYKVISAVIGTSYYSILLYIVQTQAISHSMNTHHTLTSIHDRVNSWAGLGSSMATLCQQLTLPASVSATLAIFGYFSVISTLHVTTPALISVEAFNSTASSQVAIEALPQWPDSDHEATMSYLQNNAEFLVYIGALDLSRTVGLFNGTLYDSLTDVYGNSGLVNVSATGFEVKCGYLLGVAMPIETTPTVYGDLVISNFSFGQFGWTQVALPASADVLVTLTPMPPNSMYGLQSGFQDPGLSDSIMVYTTNQVLDSAGNSGFPVEISNTSSVQQLQFLQCRRYLVPQSAQIDPGSRTIIPNTLNPVIYKTRSNWLSSADLPTAIESGSSLVNGSSWAAILSALQGPQYAISDFVHPTWGDIFVMEELGLQPGGGGFIEAATNRTIYLHEIENTLSKLIASVFWIAGHIRPPPLNMKYGFANGSDFGTIVPFTANVQKPPILEQKTTTLTQTVLAARLNVSPLAASIGLAGSVMLLVLAVIVSGTSLKAPQTSLQSMGLLQTLWVYRHHPELWEILDHLENLKPTDDNLRVTGLMNVRLLDAVSNPKIGAS
ncbi:hypothetical protein C8R45DRAFT_1013222 [Mycena sanguinolenta]|nr:hypothetical protein C8R45DRAFT_1013222 [Mycena sanguinolenta]